MRRPIVIPEIGAASFVLSGWFVKPGEKVYVGDRLVEILLDGATFDVPAPTTGTLAERRMHPGDALTPGETVGFIEEEDGEESV